MKGRARWCAPSLMTPVPCASSDERGPSSILRRSLPRGLSTNDIHHDLDTRVGRIDRSSVATDSAPLCGDYDSPAAAVIRQKSAQSVLQTEDLRNPLLTSLQRGGPRQSLRTVALGGATSLSDSRTRRCATK